MGEGFAANALKPGDAGYEYDKRVEFAAAEEAEECSWDEESSGDD